MARSRKRPPHLRPTHNRTGSGMTPDELATMRRDLVHDLAEALHATRAQQSDQQPPVAEHTSRHTHWLGEMLHHDDTTRYGW